MTRRISLTVTIATLLAAFTAPLLAADTPAAPAAGASAAQEVTMRFYQGVTAYILNPQGAAFDVTLDVRDWNLMENGPREMLLKLSGPDGRPIVRRVLEDDGIAGSAFMPETGGWDHEMWYYTLLYSRGTVPMIRWSSLTDPARLAAVPARTVTMHCDGGAPGVYRVMMAGSRDHVVTMRLSKPLRFALAGHPLWLHGHGDMFARTYVYVPKGTDGLNLGFAEYDQPGTRSFKITAADGRVFWDRPAMGGFQSGAIKFGVDPAAAKEKGAKPDPNAVAQYDDQLLTVDVSPGKGDYMMHIHLTRTDIKPYRGQGGVPAVFAFDPETAKALKGGAIYHDNEVFWHPFQVRLHDWLAKIKPDDFIIRDADGNEIKPSPGPIYGFGFKSWLYKGLPERPGYVTLNGGNEAPPLCDTLMHNYPAHHNPAVLNVSIRDLAAGLRQLTVGDTPVIGSGWNGNLGYLFGTYGWAYWRPAWRILQESNAAPEVKAIINEAIIQSGDRIAFGRGIERTNGNALSHIPQALRYAVAATKDPMITELLNVYFDRFVNGKWGRGVGISPSGDCQEHFAHDLAYGTYIVANYRAVVADFADPKFKAVLDRVHELYTYINCADLPDAPWGSRTHEGTGLGKDALKSEPGPDFTVSVNGGGEWFAAHRPNYYLLTFHGRLAPEWLNNYFNTRIGYGGGVICQLTVPGMGTVIGSSTNGSYGKGMERANWANFHIHSVVGTLADGRPLVAADSEHLNVRLDGNTVTGSGDVRDRPINVSRRYTYHKDRIECDVQLADTVYRQALHSQGPDSRLTEAFEMIPYVSKKDSPTRIIIIGDGNKTVEAATEPAMARGVVIDRGGFGVTVEFDQARMVKLGANQTVLVQLIDGPSKPGDVHFAYTLIPFQGNGPAAAKREPQRLPSIAAIDSPARLADAMANVAADDIQIGGKPAATVKIARSGNRLAVVASIKDPKIQVTDPAWKGSCLEVYGALPGDATIGHVFLAPATDKARAAAFVANKDNTDPAADILVESKAVAGGYEISALIPLKRLALDAAKNAWLLELQVITHDAQGKMQFATRFGSTRAYQQTARYGLFEVKP